MITILDAENLKGFEHLIPTDYVEHIFDPTWFFLGAYREEKGKNQAVGVLIFSVDTMFCPPLDYSDFKDALTEEEQKLLDSDAMPCATLRWVLVDKEYRKQGFFGELMNAFYDCLEASEINPVLCDLPDHEDYYLLASALEQWGFIFDDYEKLTYESSLASIEQDISLKDKLSKFKPSKQMISLKELPETFREPIWKELTENPPVPALDEDFVGEIEAYDRNLSLVFLDEKRKVKGCFLVRRLASSALKPVLLWADEKFGKPLETMFIEDALLRALRDCPKETLIKVECKDQWSGELLEELFPKADTMPYLRGISLGQEENEEN